MSTTRYMIIEDGSPMDGEIYTHERVLGAVQYADTGSMVAAFDLTELRRDGKCSMRDVTEDICHEAWRQDEVHNERARCGLVGEYVDMPEEAA